MLPLTSIPEKEKKGSKRLSKAVSLSFNGIERKKVYIKTHN